MDSFLCRKKKKTLRYTWSRARHAFIPAYFIPPFLFPYLPLALFLPLFLFLTNIYEKLFFFFFYNQLFSQIKFKVVGDSAQHFFFVLCSSSSPNYY